MPTIKATPTFQTASVPMIIVAKRSPLSLLTSRPAKRELSTCQKKDDAKNGWRKQPQQGANGTTEKNRRDKQYDAEDNLARPRTELHMARHTAGAVAHRNATDACARQKFMKPVE